MSELSESAFLRTIRGESAPHVPVWFMRQAGRSLPEYLKVREGVKMLDACVDPDLVTEITMQPVRRYGVDAAILFSDIVVPIKVAGVDLDIVPGVGPVVEHPIASLADVKELGDLTAEQVPWLTRAITNLVSELDGTPLIGFAGAPFTVASYLVEGGPSKDHAKTKAMMFGAPELWDALMSRIAEICGAWLQVQVAAGASAVQLFDSWAGALSRTDYQRYVMPYSTRVFAAVPEVPKIHFGVGTGEILDLMGEAGADVVGVDWRVPLDAAVTRVGDRCVQGNLDPAAVFAPPEELLARADAVVAAGRAAKGHIFNLGHGVIPQTDPDQLARLVDHLHAR